MRYATLFVFASLMLAGCGGGGEGGDGGGPNLPAASGMLRKVQSASELEDLLKSSLVEVVQAAPPSGAVFTTSAGAAGFSQTYTAEAGVDEFDYVRYDGTHLYIAPSPMAGPNEPHVLRILRTDVANGSATQVSSIPVEADQNVLGIYAANARLVMLTGNSNFGPRGPFGTVWLTVAYWQPTELKLHVYDVSNPAHPAEILSAQLDGAFVQTRRIGDRVYLVTRHTPSVLNLPDARTRLQSMTLADLLPKFRSGGRTRPLVTASDCYITNEERHHGYPILTTVSSFSMRNPDDFVSTCYNEESNGVYASTTALYVSQQEFIGDSASFTRIHKFTFTDAAPLYAGSVRVPGHVWTSGQNDFRLNEYQGMLRVLTTEGKNDPADWQDHHLYVIRPKANELALEVISSLPNDARPEEIGKPSEGLHGVRFLGDRAFAVTFRQVDPLYVLDLANPADPRIAGQLDIPGFSDFLHPVTRDLLLGLGRDASHVKLELFDVSVLEQPQSRGSLMIDGWYSFSEAIDDRHAFAWLPGDGSDRFAIPATVTPNPQVGGWFQSGLYQYEILGKQNAASASLQPAGIVTKPSATDAGRWAYTSRAFVHGDTVFYVADGMVFSTFWSTPTQVRGPY